MAGQMGLIYEDDKRYSKLLDKIDDVDSLNKRTTQSSDDFTQSLLGDLSPQSNYGTTNSGTTTNTNTSTTTNNSTANRTFNIDVTASNSSDYTLSGSDRNGSVSGSDPNLTFNLEDSINFSVDASGHPFYLKTVAGTGTGNLISGITNNGTENATITWTADNRGTYYYQCSLHGGMVGTITIQ